MSQNGMTDLHRNWHDDAKHVSQGLLKLSILEIQDGVQPPSLKLKNHDIS